MTMAVKVCPLARLRLNKWVDTGIGDVHLNETEVHVSDIGKHVIAAGSGKTDESDRRRSAVAAALEVIATYAGSGNPKFSLSDQMGKLSEYADIIEKAIEKK